MTEPQFKEKDLVEFWVDADGDPVWDMGRCTGLGGNTISKTGAISKILGNDKELIIVWFDDQMSLREWHWPTKGHPDWHPDQWSWPGFLKPAGKSASTKPCDCGAKKLNTTHVDWCSSRK